MRIRPALFLMIILAGLMGTGNAGAAEPEPLVPPAPAVVPAPTPAPPVRRPRVVAPKDERELYVSVADYGWREKDLVDGSRLMKESGTLIGVGFIYEHTFMDRMSSARMGIEFFGGNVDYDGATQAGVPVKTDTTYFGIKVKGDVGRSLVLSEKSSIKPFAGLGLWAWTRTADDSIAADGSTAYGYSEDWIFFHIRLGAQGTLKLSDSSRLFLEGGMKLPLYNENYAHIGNGITINPGKKASYFAETGMRINAFKLSLFYDGLRFSASDVDPVTGLYQPESIADMIGVKAGVVF